VYPETSPRSQRIRRMTKMVHSIGDLPFRGTPAGPRRGSRAIFVPAPKTNAHGARGSASGPGALGGLLVGARSPSAGPWPNRGFLAGEKLAHDFGSDGSLLAHDAGAVDDVAQFAGVAWPVVARQQLDRLGVPARRAGYFLLLDVPAEVLGEQRNVLAARGEGGQRNREDVEPVVQVLAQLAVPDAFLRLAIRSEER